MSVSGYDLICIGGSWGGLDAVSRILADVPGDLEQAIVIALHRHPDSSPTALAELLALQIARPVRDVEDKLEIEPRHVYVAPPDYHLLVEPGMLALSLEERVQFARPSIDVLFESAADAYRERVIGVILTGANEDGAAGLRRIKERGGVAVVQDPSRATRRAMPDAAIAATVADAVLPLDEIGKFLYGLCVPPTGVREETPA
jgi:two-component system chemotaxis response regulator CheB